MQWGGGGVEMGHTTTQNGSEPSKDRAGKDAPAL